MLGICRVFHVLPSQVLAEDAELLQMLAIEDRGGTAPGQRDRAAGVDEHGGWEA